MKMNLIWHSAGAALLSAALFLAPPLRAQVGAADDGPAGGKPAASATAATPASPAQDKKETSAPAKPARDPHIKPGSDYPHWELFLGYSFLNSRFGPGIDSKDANGGSASLEYNFNHWFGLVGDLGGYDFGKITDPTLPPVVITGAHHISYLFGPRLNYRFGYKEQHTVFGQFLVGGIHGNTEFANPSATENAFAAAMGGGLDVGFTKHFAWRVAQVEYLLTNFDYHNTYSPQNNFRFSSGALFRWGAKPIFVNKPPSASCSTDVASIIQGSGDSVPVRANASDPDGDSLTYSWSASAGRVDGTGSVARWTAGDAAPGSYTISARVDDGHGGTASCSSTVRVDPRPVRPPTLTCSVDRTTVLPGEIVGVTGNGNSPEGFPLEYTWRTNGGQIKGSGARVQLDTTGAAPGAYAVTGRVTDGHGGAADCVAAVNVAAPPAKPQASSLGECIFKKLGSARVDNVCSRHLDDVVVRLQNDPKSKLVIIGYADPEKEKKTPKLAQERADNVKKYVTDKKRGIDPGRVTTKAEAGVAGGDTANRRAELILVPEGATY